MTATTHRIPLTLLSLAAAALVGGCGGGDPTGAASVVSAEAERLTTEATAAGTATAKANFVKVASEGGAFKAGANQTVRYGSGTKWATKTMTGPGTCSNAFFGGDPAYGVVKECDIDQNSGGVAWETIAAENADFKVKAGQTVRYGAGTQWATKTVSGAGSCTNAFFGGDPDYGVVKSCQVDPASGTPNWAALATENQTFSVGTAQTVRYGADPTWKVATLTGAGTCSNAFFGGDPLPNVAKTCQYDPDSGAPIWTKVAAEGASFTLAQNQTVRYGSGTKWTEMVVPAGTLVCSNASFGLDPDAGVVKECDLKSGPPVVIPPTTTPVDHSGSGPTIDMSKIPAATAERYTTDRMEKLWIDPATGLPAPYAQANLSGDIGAFREVMNYAGMNKDDPIVYPGQPGASHLHAYAGNLATAATTADNIRQSPWTVSAGGTINKTSVWVPAMIDTRSATPIAFADINLYYKGSYSLPLSTAVDITPVPVGLRMVTGNASNSNAALGAQNTRYICMGPNGENPGWKNTLSAAVADGTCKTGGTLLMEVGFPVCWDGVNLDSPDHKSHMSFFVQDQTAPFAVHCPSTHPKILPTITINANYPIRASDSVADWKLSSDKYDPTLPAGLSGHGDYMMGWDPNKRPDLFQGANDTVVEHWTQHCLRERRDCHDYLVGDNVNTLY